MQTEIYMNRNFEVIDKSINMNDFLNAHLNFLRDFPELNRTFKIYLLKQCQKQYGFFSRFD